MITGPLIATWVVGSAIGATAGYWVTRAWKKLNHEQSQTKAQVASLKAQLEGGPSNEGQSL